MCHAGFCRLDFLAGSGVDRAGCRTLASARLSRSRMFWTAKGTNTVISSRCAQRFKRFERYSEDRAAAYVSQSCRAPRRLSRPEMPLRGEDRDGRDIRTQRAAFRPEAARLGYQSPVATPRLATRSALT